LHKTVGIWAFWLALTSFLTAPYLRWEIEYFRSPGPQFYKAALALIPLLLLASGAYLRVRGRRIRSLEIPAIFLLPAAGLAVYRPQAVLVCALLFLSAVTAGLRIARLLGLAPKSAGDVATLGAGLGFTLLMLLLFVLGLAHALFAWLTLALLLLPLALFRQEAIRGLEALARIMRSPATWPEMESPIAGLAVVFIAVAAVCTVAVTVAPSVAFDPLATHLAAAKFYALRHALLPLPSTSYSYYPQGCETLMALSYGLAGQAGAQFVSPLFWVLLLILVFALARECGLSQVEAFTGTVCAATMPFAHWAGSNSKDDAAMFFFQAASLYAFLRWVKTRERGWIPAGAALLGATFAIKHTALFGAVPLACLYVYALARSCATPRKWLLCGVLFAVSGLYWDARTFVLTGNPLYPGTVAQSVTVGIASPGNTAIRRLVRYAQVVWQIQFGGQAVFESPLYNPAGIAPIVFLPLAFLVARRRDGARRACLFFAATYLTYWLATSGAIRYALLPFCLLTALLAGNLATFYDQVRIRAVRASLVCAFAGVLLLSVLGIAIIEINGPMLALLTRRIDGAAYLRAVLPGYGAVVWLNGNREAGAAVAVQDFARAYAPDPGVFFTPSLDYPDLKRIVVEHAASFVILPEGVAGVGIQEYLPASWDATLAYGDAHFAVYRIATHR
jgi:hypothetical protein